MRPTPEYIKEQTFKAYTRSLKSLSYRPRSIKEIRDRLLKKEFDPLIIENVIAQLEQENLLNDEEFTKWWIEQRQEFKGLSNFAIKGELMQKGIAPQIIEKVLNAQGNDLATAKALFEKKKKRFAMYKGKEHFQKAAAFLQRKGFSYDIIKQVLKEDEE